MSAVKQVVEQRQMPPLETTSEEFVVGPAMRRQAPVTKRTSQVHVDNSVIVSDSVIDQTLMAPPVVKTSARKETISLLLDRSKKLRDAMINSILDTENTIKAAEMLYDSKQISQFHE